MPNQSSETPLAPDVVHPLVAYRKQHGLTQEGLAEQLEVARGTVARWENGRRIDDKLLERVSGRTGIPRSVLRLADLIDDKPMEGAAQ